MPYFCRSLISQALNHGAQRSLSGSKVLVLGVSYKADVADTRESPALKLIELLRNARRRGRLPRPARARAAEHGLTLAAARRRRLRLRRDRDRPLLDRLRALVVEDAKLVVDFRNATGRNGRVDGKVWKL